MPAYADPKRILLLKAIDDKPLYVSALAGYLNGPQPTASRHLQNQSHRSLVITKCEEPSVVYHLADLRIIKVLEIMRQLLYDSSSPRSTLLQRSLVA